MSNTMFLLVKGAGHLPVASISVGTVLTKLNQPVVYSDNLKPHIQESEVGQCDWCHRHGYGKRVQTLTGEHFVCMKDRKLAYKL